MASTILVSCPHCKKQLKVPAEILGKQVRCKNCGSTFPVKADAPAGPRGAQQAQIAKKKSRPGDDSAPKGRSSKEVTARPPAAKKPDAAKAKAKPKVVFEDEEDANPYGVTDVDLTPRCPHCAKEMESEDAVLCIHCGYNTVTRSHVETKRTYENTPVQQALWLLPGIACVLAVLLLGAFDFWFWYGLKETWDSWDKQMENGSWSMGARVWVVFMTCLVAWKCLKFAHKRLVLNPIRPETEK